MPCQRRRPLDYDALKRLIKPAQVLQLLGVRYRSERYGQVRAGCPIHRSRDPRSRTFRANDEVWYCPRCRVSGDAKELYALVRGLSKLEAAYELCALLGIPEPFLPGR